MRKSRRMAPGLCLGSSLLIAAVGLSSPALAVQQATTDDLQTEIRALQESLKLIQKDLQEIKSLLERQAPQPSGIGTVIDFGATPAKGERTAKLTLVEFSDYQ